MFKRISRLSLNYHAKKLSTDEMKLLAYDWARTLGGTPEDVMDEAVDRHMKESRYFPTIHDLHQMINVVWTDRHIHKEIPEIEHGETVTPEEAKKFADNIRTIIKLKSVPGGKE